MNLYLSAADLVELNEEFEIDFSKNPDLTGRTHIHREYILKEEGDFVPQEWGWNREYVFFHLANFVLSEGHFGFRIRKSGADTCIYCGPLTPTLYRLIAEANGIPIPEKKQ